MNRQLKFSFLLLILVLLVYSCKNKAHETSRIIIQSTYYQEQYRPQFHFSPEAHWMNDPNGLVYYKNEYHLFYQYYPDSTVWGPMHWGHAVSRDLIHWRHLPIALYPDSPGYIFSGSAVVDSSNTSGFGTDSIPPIVAIFTSHNPDLEKNGSIRFQNQSVAYSIDKGRTWTKYSKNPVLKNPGKRDFRDPKMFWNKQISKWELILAVYDRVNIYSSPNLRDWTFESEFGKEAGAHGGVWECPDLFPLAIEGTNKTKWIMLVSINPGGPNKGSATQYFTGDFDGHKFIPDDISTKWIDWGRDNYAGVTWSDIPADENRKIFIGWMSNWNYASKVPTKVWRGAMTIPRELSLISDNGRFFLTSKPVREFGDLRIPADTTSIKNLKFNGETEISSGKVQLMQSELFFSFNLSDPIADTLGIIFENKLKERLVIGYSTIKKQFYIDRRSAGNSGFSNDFAGISTSPYTARTTLKLHFLVDAASAELFVDDGRLVMTSLVFPTQKYTTLKMFSRGAPAILNKAVFYGIDKIWR